MKKGCLIPIVIFVSLMVTGIIIGAIQNSKDSDTLNNYIDQLGNEEASIALINLFTEDFDYQASNSLIGISFESFKSGINIPEKYEGIATYETIQKIESIRYDNYMDDISEKLTDENKYTQINTAIILAAKNYTEAIDVLLDLLIKESDIDKIKGYTFAICALLNNNDDIKVDEEYLDQMSSKYDSETDDDIISNYTMVLSLLGHEQLFYQVVSELDSQPEGNETPLYLLELFKKSQIVEFKNKNKETMEKLTHYYNATSDNTIEELLISIYQGINVAYYYNGEEIRNIYISMDTHSLSKNNEESIFEGLIEQFEKMGFTITKKERADLTINVDIDAHAVKHKYTNLASHRWSYSYSETSADIIITVYDKMNDIITQMSDSYTYKAPQQVGEGAYSTEGSAPYEESIYPACVEIFRQIFGDEYVWLLITVNEDIFSSYAGTLVRTIAHNDLPTANPIFTIELVNEQ